MSELQREEERRVRLEIEIAINSLRTEPEGPESFYFVQAVINYAWNGIPIERSWYQEQQRPETLKIFSTNSHHFEFSPHRVGSLKAFITKFFLRACQADKLFFNNEWLSHAATLLVEMQKYPSLEWVGSYLASLFIDPYHKVYNSFIDELNSKRKIIQNGNVTETIKNQLQEDVAIIENDLEHLKHDLISFMSTIKHSLSKKQPNPLLPNQLKIIFKILPRSFIFENQTFYFDFYLTCLQSQNYTILTSALTNIHSAMNEQIESEENIKDLLNFMCEESTSTILFCLTTMNNTKIVEKALWIVLKLFESNLRPRSWRSEECCTLFLNIFHKSKQIRSLAGQLMLIALKKYSDAKKLENILDFYLQYQKSPLEMSVLIEALWDFDYMKDIDNIKPLFENPFSETYKDTGEVRNAALAYFCVAMLEQLKKAEDETRILKFMKSLPKLFTLLENNSVHLSILIRIFSIIDAKYYEPTSIGDQKYADELTESFAKSFLNCTDIYCFKNAVNILTNLARMRYYRPKHEFKQVATTIFNDFKDKLHAWTAETEVTEDFFKNLHIISNKISTLLEIPSIFSPSQYEELYQMDISSLFDQQKFNGLPSEIKALEVIFLEILSCLLIVRLESVIETGNNTDDNIKEVKPLIQKNISIANELLECHQNDHLIVERSVKVITQMYLILQPSFLFSKNKVMRGLAAKLDSNIYRCVWNTCTDILCNDRQFDWQRQMFKRNILFHLTEFQRDYSGLPAITIDSKYFADLLLNCIFTTEVNSLFLAVAEYKTPFDGKHRRISALLAGIFLKWGDEGLDSRVATKRLVDLFKNRLEDWPQLFATIILQTISALIKRLSVLRPERNRMMPLSLLKPFVFDNKSLERKVATIFRSVLGDLRQDERKFVHDFQSVLSKNLSSDIE